MAEIPVPENMCAGCQHPRKPEDTSFGLVNEQTPECYFAVRKFLIPPSDQPTYIGKGCPQGEEDVRVIDAGGQEPKSYQQFHELTEGRFDYRNHYE